MTDMIQPEPILQSRLRETPWDSPATSRLPGTGPVAPGDWLRLDDAYSEQMALRDRLIADRPGAVHALDETAMPAAQDLLTSVLGVLHDRPDFSVTETQLTRPDGQAIAIDTTRPLLTLGRLVQPDFCILQKRGDEHILSGAILCFPASWSLDEKFMRPLTTIHDPVSSYTGDVARRVQRLFDAVRTERPIWRANLLLYDDFALFQPRRTTDRRQQAGARYVRSERQCISRLPRTDAMVFAIHTTVVDRTGLPANSRAEMRAYLEQLAD